MVLFALLFACSVPNGMQEHPEIANETSNHTVIVVHHPISLADILIQVPGVVVTRQMDQTFVTIRGGSPHYVVDGIRIGNSYQQAIELVNIFDIESVEIIRGASESAIYGPGSGHGVVLIHTQGGNEIEG